MSGPGRPTRAVYKEVWVAPVHWEKPFSQDWYKGDQKYPKLLGWVYENDYGWHGWESREHVKTDLQTTWLKGLWKEVACPHS